MLYFEMDFLWIVNYLTKYFAKSERHYFIVIDALIQGKGIEIGIKKTWFGVPYGFDASVC